MDTPDRTTQFSQPVRQILSMLIVLGLVGFGVRILAPKVASVFLANPYLNGFIGFVFGIGVLSCFWQVYQVAGSVRWLTGFASGDQARAAGHAPRLLAPLATLLKSRSGMMRISANGSRSILDSVATRIDEARDITRYIVNLLIFLGLLGTFYGLATTVPALVETIRSLAPRAGEEGLDVFSRLMSGLEGQLDGMGVAFASSLLGLAGSLVVGLLELFAGHGQNRFYRELEEWLSTITRVGFSAGDGDSSGETAAFGPLIDLLQGQFDAMQAHGGSAEAGAALDAQIARLADAVETLAGQIDAEGGPDPMLTRIAEGQDRLVTLMQEGTTRSELTRIAEGQDRLVALTQEGTTRSELTRIAEGQARMVALMEKGAVGPELARLADGQAQLIAHLAERARSPELEQIAEGQARMVALMEESGAGTLDAESRMHLRSIDAQLLRLLEDIAAGRQEAVDDLRSELAQLSRLVRQIGMGRRQEAPTPIVGRRT